MRVTTLLVRCSEWTSSEGGTPKEEPLGGGGSAVCTDTNSRRLLRPWPPLSPRVEVHGLVPEDALTQAAGAVYYEMDTGEDDGSARAATRPAPLMEVLPQVGLGRHNGIAYKLVQALDDPVLQTVEQLPNVVQFFSTQLPVVAEPVIAVPNILPHDVPPRRLCRDTQLAEQLAEVPTILYFLKQRIPKQIVDNPVPNGGEQTVDFPAPCSSVRRLQGFLPEQSSTVTSSSSLERISERIVEQIAVSRGFGEGLQDFLPGQSSSSSSHDPARIAEALDEPGENIFRTFPQIKKSAKLGPHSSRRVHASVS